MLHVSKTRRDAVWSHIRSAGYTDRAIAAGQAYAERMGYAADAERGALILSRILYSELQLAQGERAGWPDPHVDYC